MKFTSPLSKRTYLYELRQQMDEWSNFGQSRFTGFIIGNFFYITNHSSIDFFYGKIISFKSRAFGFVTACGDETLVRTITTYGDGDLISLIRNFVVWYFLSILVFTTGTGYFAFELFSLPMFAIQAAVIALMISFGSAVGCWWYENGRANMFDLRHFLENPKRFWADEEESEP